MTLLWRVPVQKHGFSLVLCNFPQAIDFQFPEKSRLIHSSILSIEQFVADPNPVQLNKINLSSSVTKHGIDHGGTDFRQSFIIPWL